MATVPRTPAPVSIAARFAGFVIERFPLAAPDAIAAFTAACPSGTVADGPAAEQLARPLAEELRRRRALGETPVADDTMAGVGGGERMAAALEELVEACNGFLQRTAIELSLTPAERLEILRGLFLTRATDNRLKAFFTGNEIKYSDTPFQGKGFRSLGQEAVYAAAVRLRRGEAFRSVDGRWRGDVVAPVIRDAAVAIAMRPTGDTVRMILNAQMAKAGPPMDGRDLHIGGFDWGVLPPSAPLTVATLTVAGLAMAFARERSGRVAVSFIGEGGASLGEWHEAINACAARQLPAIFCVENNQTALSTPVAQQSAVRAFADKAAGYGIPGITVDGTDPDRIAAAVAWAADRARAGHGPTLIELVCMRMCGHAHHDDMLYLGRDPQPSWEYAIPGANGYADRERFAEWAARDPLVTYSARLVADGITTADQVEAMKAEAMAMVEREASAIVTAPWPEPSSAGTRVLAGEEGRRRREPLDAGERLGHDAPGQPPLDPGPPVDPGGRTFLDAIALGVGDALRRDPRVFVYGEDVGAPYGNAFLLLRPLLAEFGDRLINSPLAEGAILGVCVGAAIAGQRPIGEIQFNDFVATGFNQLVNNAAKIRYRWGADVPMVVRLPWGGLRHAGPYHSQNTEAWFYRTPGLKIVVPSTPYDARALLATAVADPDPVLFYEHIALYRDPRIRQRLGDEPPEPLPIGRAALRRAGRDLAIVSYGAYVHVALRVATTLAAGGIEASVLDLRWLSPLDRETLVALARSCHRLLIVHEDSRTGGVGESLAAIIQEDAFEWLDAPVRIIGALDTPVPYSPPLEAFVVPDEAVVERAARLLVAY